MTSPVKMRQAQGHATGSKATHQFYPTVAIASRYATALDRPVQRAAVTELEQHPRLKLILRNLRDNHETMH